jgi:group I intron endonuclease
VIDRVFIIYAILHIASGRRYVGSTLNVKSRWAQHKSALRANRHHCEMLQEAWNQFGDEAFTLVILNKSPSAADVTRFSEELSYINAAPCYNSIVTETGLNNFGTSDAVRAAIAQTHRNRLDSDSAYRAKYAQLGANVGEFSKTPERREIQSQLSTERWKDEAHRASVSAALAEHWDTPGVREEHSERVKEVRNRPEVKEKFTKSMKDAWADPNSGLRNRSDGRWSDPAAREKKSQQMKELHAKRREAKVAAARAAALAREPESH